MDKIIVTQADQDRAEMLWRRLGPWRMGSMEIAAEENARHRIEAQRPLLEALETIRDKVIRDRDTTDDWFDLVDIGMLCTSAIKQAKGE